jgi:hypothetical protein
MTDLIPDDLVLCIEVMKESVKQRVGADSEVCTVDISKCARNCSML